MARDAAWWREYRAEKKRREVPRAVTIDETQTVKAYAPLNVHAACDQKIAALTAEVRRLNGLVMVYQPVYEGMRDAPGNAAVAQTMLASETLLPVTVSKPSFLAAPDEDCVCGHDRHAYHVSGACGAWVNRKRCSCQGFMADLGFG